MIKKIGLIALGTLSLIVGIIGYILTNTSNNATVTFNFILLYKK